MVTIGNCHSKHVTSGVFLRLEEALYRHTRISKLKKKKELLWMIFKAHSLKVLSNQVSRLSALNAQKSTMQLIIS